ncbi:MAG: hypothetical protein ACRDU9_01915 [Acidimicrobiia bacterium]
MIFTDRLIERLDGDRVVFDKLGEPVDLEAPDDVGPATLLVKTVTDALKLVEDGVVEGSVDRSAMWVVEAIILDRVVLERIGPRRLSVEDLLTEVRQLGFAWQVSPISAP